MNPAEGNPGINNLARTLQGRMAAHQEARSSLVLDFGEIQPDYSLLTNTYPVPIPKSDYLVCRQLTLGGTSAHLTYTIPAGHAGDGTHTHGSSGKHAHDGGSHGGHTGGDGSHHHDGGEHTHPDECPHVHDVLIPEKMRKLKPGDRVLVAWVQNDAIVVDLVLPASEL